MNSLILTPKEINMMQMGLQLIIENNDMMSKTQQIPFNPAARQIMKDIREIATSAIKKLQNVSGRAVIIEKYKEGDEEDFLTKES